MVTVWPATLSAAVRAANPGFAAAEYRMLPMPDWLAPCVKVNQGALLVACQLQVLPFVFNRTSPVEAVPTIARLAGTGMNTHEDGAASLILAMKPFALPTNCPVE